MFFIKKSIVDKIQNTIGKTPVESGGILGIKQNIICEYYFDNTKNTKNDEYYPNYRELNKIICEWYDKGITFLGIIHSHPNSCNKPSIEDFNYAKLILENNRQIDTVIFPIVTIIEKQVIINYYKFQHEFEEIEVKILND